MRFHLISDNVDTIVGMRLVGIPGVIAQDTYEVELALREALAMEDISVILIAEKLVTLCPDLIYGIKMNNSRPLLVEVPDRHGGGGTKDAISRYVRESVGIKI